MAALLEESNTLHCSKVRGWGGGEIYCVLVFSKYTVSYLVVLSLITGIFPLKAVAGFMLITLKQISQIYLVEECVKPQPPNGIM